MVGVPGGMVRLILGLFRFGCFFCLRLFFCFSLRRCVFRRFFFRLHGCGLCRGGSFFLFFHFLRGGALLAQGFGFVLLPGSSGLGAQFIHRAGHRFGA